MPSSARHRGGAQPAAHAANAHEIGHDVIPGAGADRLIENARPVEVFAELHRRPKLAELRVAGKIVVDDRLLEPVEGLIVERGTAPAHRRA